MSESRKRFLAVARARYALRDAAMHLRRTFIEPAPGRLQPLMAQKSGRNVQLGLHLRKTGFGFSLFAVVVVIVVVVGVVVGVVVVGVAVAIVRWGW